MTLAERMTDPRLGPRPVPPPSVTGPVTARAQVLDHLQDLGGWQRVTSLADATQSHPNTVREHLDELVDAGLVERRRATPGGRGRPAWLYRAVAPSTSQVGAEHAALAATLAEHLAVSSPDPRGAAIAAGARWGRRLVADQSARQAAAPTPIGPPNAADTSGGVHESVLSVLNRLHFAPAPTADPNAYALRQCPLLDTARQYPEIVCGVHEGIITGALQALGAPADGVELVPFAGPGCCLLRLPAPPQKPAPRNTSAQNAPLEQPAPQNPAAGDIR